MDFTVVNPKSKSELLSTIDSHQKKNFRFGAGYTDLINQLKNKETEDLTVINLAQLEDAEFSEITEDETYFILGTLVTASDLLKNEAIKLSYPVLYQAADSVASTQIRNLATIGGNICNASPAADMSAALVSLQAICCILDTNGNEREEKLEHFIQGVGKTSLKSNEVLRAVKFPKNITSKVHSGFEKVGTRKSMEISIVSLAYHFQLDEENIVVEAGLAIGAVAPTIPFALEACNFIRRQRFDQFKAHRLFADTVLTYAHPITDIRATDWYRKEVLGKLTQSIFE